MSITITEKAAAEVKKAKEQTDAGDTAFLRVGVAAGGCAGFDYKLGFDTAFNEETDTKIETGGIEVVIDKKSQLYLEGTTIDWYESLEKRGFTFNNPNAQKTCGCGSSFQV